MSRDNTDDLYANYLAAIAEMDEVIKKLPDYAPEKWYLPDEGEQTKTYSREEFERLSPEKQQEAARPYAERKAELEEFVDELNQIRRGSGENKER